VKDLRLFVPFPDSIIAYIPGRHCFDGPGHVGLVYGLPIAVTIAVE
jgi:hypothetical protein